MVHKLFSINGLVLLELFFVFLFHFFDDVFQLGEFIKAPSASTSRRAPVSFDLAANFSPISIISKESSNSLAP